MTVIPWYEEILQAYDSFFSGALYPLGLILLMASVIAMVFMAVYSLFYTIYALEYVGVIDQHGFGTILKKVPEPDESGCNFRIEVDTDRGKEIDCYFVGSEIADEYNNVQVSAIYKRARFSGQLKIFDVPALLN